MNKPQHKRPLSQQELDSRLGNEDIANEVVKIVQSEAFDVLLSASLNLYKKEHPTTHSVEHIQKHNTISVLAITEFKDKMIQVAYMNKGALIEIDDSEEPQFAE